MKRYLISLLVTIFTLCTICTLSIADGSTQIVEYAEDNELTPYSFEALQDRLSIELDKKWKQFVFFWPKDNHVEVDECTLDSLPIVASNQHEVVLFIFNRNSRNQQWILSSVNEKALVPCIKKGHIRLRSFSCWKFYEESLQDINLYYLIEIDNKSFAMTSCFTHTTEAETNWQFEAFTVQPSETMKSEYIPELYYDDYAFTLTKKLTGSVRYAKNEEDILGFESCTVAVQQFNAKEFDMNKYLSPLALMVQTVVDTSEHGNGKTLTLRDKPNGKKIGKISNGSEVFISSTQTDWTFIIGKNKAGFVNAKFIKSTDAYLKKN